MIVEVNLVPDIKQELINAQRMRLTVTTVAFFAGAIAVAIVGVLAFWVYAAQPIQDVLVSQKISGESKKLSSYPDVENILTIQNQLSKLPVLHDSKHINSRVFDIISKVASMIPDNQISISRIVVDTSAKTISLDAQAPSGFSALEMFKKTIEATKFEYKGKDGQVVSVPLATSIAEGDRSYGQSSSGDRVLVFKIVLTYSEDILKPYLDSAQLVGPNGRIDVTDSSLGIPRSLFSPKATNLGESK